MSKPLHPLQLLFLEYYFIVVRRGALIGMQVIHGPLARMLCTYWIIHMCYDHSSFQHVLLVHHVHNRSRDHNLYLCILCRSCSYLCHGLRY